MIYSQLKQIIPLQIALTVLLLSSCEGDVDELEAEYSTDQVTSSNAPQLNETFEVGKPSNVNEKVYMHYLAWFGEGIGGRHWTDGTVSEPLIGYYDSQSWATHLYHILLSAAVGIDGAVINVRTEYDQQSFEKFIESIKRIDAIYPDFEYDISLSTDDQDATINSVTQRFSNIRDSIIPNTTHYLYKNGEPVIFIWDYAGNVSPQEYRNIANNVFYGSPVLLKNEIDVNAVPGQFVMNSYYPWIQGWASDGSEWGQTYLNWFYNTKIDFQLNNKVEFVTGAVWPGFDDRNVVWGQNRWIDRRGGQTYTDTWSFINNSFTGDIDWVILETWNDFNEGSELEPTTTDNYQYLGLTATHIASYKGEPSLIDSEQWMFKAAIKIYEAAKLIEDGDRDCSVFHPILEDAIEHYLKTNGQEAHDLAEQIILG
ncbi:glycoside hydrolase family 71/99 protein [Marinoscillum furvescens]|uniref:Glycosyl hydrolase family 71 n=1 Tax=Marinoscillum furvescens DSM 4134 TaxID=1122208 RepID=A0A3D9L204_MARFU|nr:hypothetical protein [Marinoscillum furvescens]RED98382.1 hypothetical protein C7460_11054 [Marinoscillum furvescens DSM 4134]